jgi:CheY-like chemotaxis protein
VGHSQAAGAIRVLIVDDDHGFRRHIERTLRAAGFETASAGTLRQAMERVRGESFDAVLCDLRMGGGDGDSMAKWVASYAPSTRIVIATADLTDAEHRTYAAASGVRVLDKPIHAAQLVETLRELGAKRGFYGNSIEVELFDYVQMIALTGRDKLVEVDTPRGKGLIWFEHGDIVHVEYDQYRGELAFYKLLSVGRGAFRELFGGDPPRRTVTRSSTHLLMEAARQTDEGTLGKEAGEPIPVEDAETSFEALNELDDESTQSSPSVPRPAVMPPAVPTPVARAPSRPPPPVLRPARPPRHLRPLASDNEEEDFAALVDDAIEEQSVRETFSVADEPDFDVADSTAGGIIPEEDLDPSESSAAMSMVAGHSIFDDPDMRSVMLEQFWQFEGINGVAIISSTGKVLAEDMRSNSSLVTLAGFYMRGAARIARTLGYNVFDGVVARSVNGQQMVMVSMGAASAVLSVEQDADPEKVRDLVMGIE